MSQHIAPVSPRNSSASVSLTHTRKKKLPVLPLTLHLCAMQRYANDSSSDVLESRVNDHVCVLECLRRTVSGREGKSACVLLHGHICFICMRACSLCVHMCSYLCKKCCMLYMYVNAYLQLCAQHTACAHS